MVAECGGSPVRVRICPLFFFSLLQFQAERTFLASCGSESMARVHVYMSYHLAITFVSVRLVRCGHVQTLKQRRARRRGRGVDSNVYVDVEYRQVHEADWKPDHCCFRELGRSFSQFWVLLVYRSRNSGIAKERMSILDTSGSPDMLRVARRVSDEYRRRSLKKRGRKNRTRHHAKRMR